MSKVSLSVNGRSLAVDVDLDSPLFYALRDDLGLNNPRFGCGMGQCGACTVLMNNEPVRSCVSPVSNAVGKRIVTLEGTGDAGEATPHPEGLHRRAGGPVRLLPERVGHGLKGAAR